MDRRHEAQQPLSQPELVSYSLQLLSAVSFCHGRSVVHRDLKPQNILIDSQGRVKVSDFGLSKIVIPMPVQRLLTQEVMTLWYRPPEILLGQSQYRDSADLW